MRLDRLLANQPDLNRRQALLLLAQGAVRVDGQCETRGSREIDRFAAVHLGERLVQAATPARYLMLHKPAGVVSATRDPEHRTVIDLIDEPWASELHIAGRLDKQSTGLLLLTNDGRWSKRLTRPEQKQSKRYYVRTGKPITADYIEQFARGIYFAFEDLTTAPAALELLGSHEARITLTEGRYHQIKRMFGFFRNPVLDLHRETIGTVPLDPALPPGAYRPLSTPEQQSLCA